VTVPVEHGSARLLEAVRTLDGLGVAVTDVGLRRATLDEVFLALTGRTTDANDTPDTHAA
jgi:ABC-2 type transport system ATP-binding protein